MDKFTHLGEFLGYLFDDSKAVEKAQAITAGILKARSCRVSEIAREMPGSEATNYKCIQRFVAKRELKSILLRLYQEEAAFMIGDPTEMPRPDAQIIQRSVITTVLGVQVDIPKNSPKGPYIGAYLFEPDSRLAFTDVLHGCLPFFARIADPVQQHVDPR